MRPRDGITALREVADGARGPAALCPLQAVVPLASRVTKSVLEFDCGCELGGRELEAKHQESLEH